MSNNQQVLEKELNEQFKTFLNTKGIKAKFKLAFEDMKESYNTQKENDAKAFNEIKEKSKEENKEFVEFLHTKGIKAKVNLVIENIKKSAAEQKEKTKEQIAKSKELGNPNKTISVNDLNKEFNAFLKQKGLDSKYIVTIEEIKQ